MIAKRASQSSGGGIDDHATSSPATPPYISRTQMNKKISDSVRKVAKKLTFRTLSAIYPPNLVVRAGFCCVSLVLRASGRLRALRGSRHVTKSHKKDRKRGLLLIFLQEKRIFMEQNDLFSLHFYYICKINQILNKH